APAGTQTSPRCVPGRAPGRSLRRARPAPGRSARAGSCRYRRRRRKSSVPPDSSAESTGIGERVQMTPQPRMTTRKRKIGVVAPGSRMSAQVPARVEALAARLYPDRTPEIHFHPQCLAAHGHFAGDDASRVRAFLEITNDESYDAVWCARGGQGSCRVAGANLRGLTPPARRKSLIR